MLRWSGVLQFTLWRYYYYCYYTICMSPVTGLFFLVFLLNQRWSPPLRLQASHCSTFRILCDVPSIAVFCSESIECFPGIVSKFFFQLLVTIPVAPLINGIIVHFRFHIFIIIIIIISLTATIITKPTQLTIKFKSTVKKIRTRFN